MATSKTTASPAAPPTTPPAIVPAGGVLLLLLLWLTGLPVLLVALDVAEPPVCPATAVDVTVLWAALDPDEAGSVV